MCVCVCVCVCVRMKGVRGTLVWWWIGRVGVLFGLKERKGDVDAVESKGNQEEETMERNKGL